MKLNVWFIIVAHIKTLSIDGPDGTSHISALDVFVFYLIPASLGCLAWYLCFDVRDAVYELSVSVFAIFSALLLSVQVAMYGVFRSERKQVNDKVLDAAAKEKIEVLRKVLREVNTNISYLILVSCFAVSLFLFFFAVTLPATIETGVLIFIYAHFILTIAMVLKRAHVVFDKEYRSAD